MLCSELRICLINKSFTYELQEKGRVNARGFVLPQFGNFFQAAPLTVDHTSVAGVQQASNDKKTIKISGSVRDAAGESIIGATILEKRNFKRCRFRYGR